MRLVIAAAAAAFLILGFLLKPDIPAPPQQESPGPLLQEAVQQREAGSVLRALQEVGAATVQYGALVSGEPDPPAAWSDFEPALAAPADAVRYGVVNGAGEIVAYVRGLSADAPVQVRVGDGRQLSGRIAGPVSAAGLARIAVEPSAPLIAPVRAAAPPAPGEPVVAAAPAPDGRLIAPLFVASAGTETLVTTTPLESFLGAPVFSAARELVGVVAMSGSAARILTLEAALRDQTATAPPPLGVTLEQAEGGGDEPAVVTVRRVDPEGRAAVAGLRAGDIVEAVDEAAVADLREAFARMSPGSPEAVRLRVRRGRRVVTVTIPPVAVQP